MAVPPVGKLVTDATRTVGSVIETSARTVAKTADTAVRTVFGTARHQAGEIVDVTGEGVRRTKGQLIGQADQTSEVAKKQSNRTLRAVDETAKSVGKSVKDAVDETSEAWDDVDDGIGRYEDWTKSDLYDLAQEKDIDGRSSMSKKQLVKALRAN